MHPRVVTMLACVVVCTMPAVHGASDDPATTPPLVPVTVPPTTTTLEPVWEPKSGSCEDNPSFFDSLGYECKDWDGYLCSDDYETMSTSEIQAVKTNCPAACRLCKHPMKPSPGMADTTTTATTTSSIEQNVKSTSLAPGKVTTTSTKPTTTTTSVTITESTESSHGSFVGADSDEDVLQCMKDHCTDKLKACMDQGHCANFLTDKLTELEPPNNREVAFHGKEAVALFQCYMYTDCDDADDSSVPDFEEDTKECMERNCRWELKRCTGHCEMFLESQLDEPDPPSDKEVNYHGPDAIALIQCYMNTDCTFTTTTTQFPTSTTFASTTSTDARTTGEFGYDDDERQSHGGRFDKDGKPTGFGATEDKLPVKDKKKTGAATGVAVGAAVLSLILGAILYSRRQKYDDSLEAPLARDEDNYNDVYATSSGPAPAPVNVIKSQLGKQGQGAARTNEIEC